MRAIILKHMLADLQAIGFVRQGKNLVLKSPETTQTIILDIIPSHLDNNGTLKRVDVYVDVEDNKHPKARDISITLGIEFENIDKSEKPLRTKTYVFDIGNIDYEHSQLHKDIMKYGLKFFEAMKTTDNYFQYLLGDLFRYWKAPIGHGDMDEDHALLALDLALKYSDSETAEKAISIVNESLKNHGVAGRSKWIRSKSAFATVADRIYTPAG